MMIKTHKCFLVLLFFSYKFKTNEWNCVSIMPDAVFQTHFADDFVLLLPPSQIFLANSLNRFATGHRCSFRIKITALHCGMDILSLCICTAVLQLSAYIIFVSGGIPSHFVPNFRPWLENRTKTMVPTWTIALFWMHSLDGSKSSNIRATADELQHWLSLATA